MVSTADASPLAVTVVTVTFAAIGVLATVLRLFTRFFVAHNAGWDDALISAAAVFGVTTVSLTVLEAYLDTQRKSHELSLDQEILYAQSGMRVQPLLDRERDC
jgi:hypothetical protein